MTKLKKTPKKSSKPSIKNYSLNDLACLCARRIGKSTLSDKTYRCIGHSLCRLKLHHTHENKCTGVCAMWISFDLGLISITKSKTKVHYVDLLPIHPAFKKAMIKPSNSTNPRTITQNTIYTTSED